MCNKYICMHTMIPSDIILCSTYKQPDAVIYSHDILLVGYINNICIIPIPA